MLVPGFTENIFQQRNLESKIWYNTLYDTQYEQYDVYDNNHTHINDGQPVNKNIRYMFYMNKDLYTNTVKSNRSIIELSDNISGLSAYAFDTAAKQLKSPIIGLTLAGFLQYSWYWSAHTYGQKGRLQAMGLGLECLDHNDGTVWQSFTYIVQNPNIPNTDYLCHNNNYTIQKKLAFQNPYVLYGGFGNNTSAYLSDTARRLEISQGFTLDAKWAGHLARKIYSYTPPHIMDFIGYSMGKLAPFFYYSKYLDNTENDLTSLDDIKLQHSDIMSASVFSYLLSPATYIYMGATYDYFAKGSHTVNAKYKNSLFRPIDVQAYFSHGISYKIESALQATDSLSFPFALETVLIGKDQASEYTLGLQNIWNGFGILNMNIITNQQDISFTSSYSQYINSNIQIKVSFDVYDTQTMFGQRNTLDYADIHTYQIITGLRITL